MKYKSCEAWYSPTSGNATIKPSAFDITDDDAAAAWCDASGDEDTEYKLYDLSKDPSETTNLIDNVAYSQVQHQMQKLYCTYFKPTYAGGTAITSSYTRENAYGDVFRSAFHNDDYVTFWTDGENPPAAYRYQIKDYYVNPDFCE